jgi:hypothetical protein
MSRNGQLARRSRDEQWRFVPPAGRKDDELPGAARRFAAAVAGIFCAISVFAAILPPPAKGQPDVAQATIGTVIASAMRTLTGLASPPSIESARPALKGSPGGIRN